MSETCRIPSASGRDARLSAADGLGLAAAPSFAVLALLTGLAGGEAMCPAAPASPLAGMALMYGLMAVFHLPAWLTLISRGDEA